MAKSGKSASCLFSPAHLLVENATVAYGSRKALCGVTFSAPFGTRVAFIGPNGAGKSTLFKALVGLLPLTGGKILIHGSSPGHHKDCVAYVPQREDVDWSFPVTVTDVVMMGRYGRLGWLRRPRREDREAVARSLEQLGIANLASVPIGNLSGGQQQRVFLARALVQEPHILIMDEPFTGVDVSTQEATLWLFDRLRELHVTVLISTHDLQLAATRFDQVILLNGSLIACGPPEKVLTPENLMEAFGGQVLSLGGMLAVDKAAHAAKRQRE
ncbi:MAG: metal ABC transporter ATP-binding protein [Syntrophobacteraceae bacterium]|nr:metal ABC transporter ATP-binding protein [Desulfobacteraceae bacterium]